MSHILCRQFELSDCACLEGKSLHSYKAHYGEKWSCIVCDAQSLDGTFNPAKCNKIKEYIEDEHDQGNTEVTLVSIIEDTCGYDKDEIPDIFPDVQIESA